MKKFPNNIVYNRTHKIKTMKGSKGINLSRYNIGLRLKESSYISYEQLESSRRAISRLMKPKETRNKKNQKMTQSAQKNIVRTFKKRKNKRKKILLIRSNIVYRLPKNLYKYVWVKVKVL
jgi:hypothetical protein